MIKNLVLGKETYVHIYQSYSLEIATYELFFCFVYIYIYILNSEYYIPYVEGWPI